jgi:2-polyprenyl-3-methyl-5-hydroxy-6-metoxy-1,4-benzoquinol methylase
MKPWSGVCNLCGSQTLETLRKIENSWHVRCAECGFIFTNPKPTAAEIKTFYDASYFTHSDGLSYGYRDYLKDKDNIIRSFAFIYKKLGKYIKPGHSLDVGCAYGFSLIAAEQCGWKARGIELASDVAATARSEFDLDVSSITLADVFNLGERYDLVTIWDVIEHLDDPMAMLRDAHAVLNPGGIIAIMTPNAGGFISRAMGDKWVMYQRGAVEHLCYFTPDTMRLALSKAGFETLKIARWGWGGKFVTVDFILTRLAHYMRFPFRLLSRAARKAGAADWAVYADIGDNLVAVARKMPG